MHAYMHACLLYKFYNRSVKLSLQDSDIDIYSIHNKGISDIIEQSEWSLLMLIRVHILTLTLEIMMKILNLYISYI